MIEYRQAALLRIALSNSIGFSASTAVPLWVGSVGGHFGFPAWGAGAVATGQLACAALFNLATPWVFRGTHLRRLAFMAAAVALLGNGLACVGSSSIFIAGCLLSGAGFGVLLNVTNRLVAGSSAPQRGYAVVQLVEVLFCMAFFLSVPPLVERFGSLSVFAALAVLCSGVFVLLAGVPVSSRAPIVKVNQRSALPNRGAAALSLCAAALLFAGQSSVNSSLVSIGAGVLGGAMLVVTLGGGGAPFVGGAVVLFMGIVFVVPYVYALLAELDEAGRAARQECWLVGR